MVYNLKMKTMEKTCIYVFFIACISSSLFAQDPGETRSREIYLSGNILTFSDFGLQYKSELQNNTWFRIGLASLNPYYHQENPGSSGAYDHSFFNISGSFDLGLEKRRSINEKLIAFYGINLYSSVNFNRNKTEDPALPLGLRYVDTYNFSSGFGFNSGLILNLSDNFAISAEIKPRLLINYSSSQYVTGTYKTTDTSMGGSFSFNSSSVSISFIYRWSKK
jgi:hypothetical protein